MGVYNVCINLITSNCIIIQEQAWVQGMTVSWRRVFPTLRFSRTPDGVNLAGSLIFSRSLIGALGLTSPSLPLASLSIFTHLEHCLWQVQTRWQRDFVRTANTHRSKYFLRHTFLDYNFYDMIMWTLFKCIYPYVMQLLF